MTPIVFTGANGFIGKELTAVLKSKDISSIGLSRSDDNPDRRWTLGDPLPDECLSAGTIIHLATASLRDASRDDSLRLDVEGTKLLIEQIRTRRSSSHPMRFIFLSSQSARANAANKYGKAKWQIERLLDQPDEIIVRPGLVYSDNPESVFASFDRLARMPVLPLVSSRKAVQPIHVRELAECLVQLASIRDIPGLIQLGAIDALSFEEAVRATAQRAGCTPPLMLPVPITIVRGATRLLDRMLSLSLTERVDGLTSLEPIDTELSLDLLGRKLAPFAPARERSVDR